MRHSRLIMTLLILGFFSGCTRITPVVNLSPKTYSYKYLKDKQPEFSHDIGTPYSVSIGETLCSIGMKYKVYANALAYKDDAPLFNSLPANATWMSRHLYQSPSGKSYEIISSRTWMGGSLGFIIDEEGVMSAEYTLVRLRNRFPFWFFKSKRCCVRNKGAPFFEQVEYPVTLWKPFGIRYSGYDKEGFRFDITNTSDQNISQRIQEIKISTADAVKGVTIKGIKMEISKGEDPGVIHYKILSRPEFSR